MHFPDNSFSCFAGILPFYTSSAELSQFVASCNGLEELSRDIIVMHFPINSSRVFAGIFGMQCYVFHLRDLCILLLCRV